MFLDTRGDSSPAGASRQYIRAMSKTQEIKKKMLAIPLYRSHVAPVLNWSTTTLIVPESGNDKTAEREMVLLAMSGFDRLRILAERNVNTLICGAIDPDLLSYAEQLGLEVIDGVAGEAREVVQAYHDRRLDDPRFRLPGYCVKVRQDKES
jgi:predicted Fe-Mo cluster-binding NifX family protein